MSSLLALEVCLDFVRPVMRCEHTSLFMLEGSAAVDVRWVGGYSRKSLSAPIEVSTSYTIVWMFLEHLYYQIATSSV